MKNDAIVNGNMMPFSLTVDHGIVDGGETTRFIKRVLDYFSDSVSC